MYEILITDKPTKRSKKCKELLLKITTDNSNNAILMLNITNKKREIHENMKKN